MKKILMVIGTRPEAIKMLPLIQLLKAKYSSNFKLCITAQHREMLDQVLDLYDIKPDYDLNIMKPHQDLYEITSNILLKMREVLNDFYPDLVLVHGDTTSTSMAALASFYQKIDIAHVEAGLRTGNLYSPWPEEANRRIVAVLAKYHFAPTEESRENLLKENISNDQIIVTGNTVIDTLFMTLEHIENNNNIKEKILQKISREYPLRKNKRIILITGHRRESFGDDFINMCKAIKTIANNNADIDIIYPVHLNPNVQKPVQNILGDVDNIYLLKPLEYEVFLYLMKISYLILTDSGGIQEEAPSLGKPVLVMRSNTERPEAVEAGTVKLVGTTHNRIVQSVQKLLDDRDAYARMSQAHNPYGDGKASQRIVSFLEKSI